MKTKITFLLALVLAVGIFSQTAKAQITVSGSNTKDGFYTSLTKADGAFTALKSVTQAGQAITIIITADVTDEDGATWLTGDPVMWTSLTINPSGARTISGSVVGSGVLCLWKGDYVTIDGLNTGGNSLTIINTSTSSTNYTSTLRFVGDATHNIVRNCTIKGSSTSTAGGIVFFDTGWTTGNDFNLIDNNIITNAGGNRPLFAIYSAGSSAENNNSDNTISNNRIYDFFNPGINHSAGIFLYNNTSDCNVTGNTFYETTSFGPIGGAFNLYVIRIENKTSGNNFKVTGNYIGGSAADHSGKFTVTSTTGHLFFGIRLSVFTTTPSSIQDNTIQNIDYTSSSGTPFYGIYALDVGSVNIGTTTGNTIGATTGTGSITVTNPTANAISFGIYNMGTGILDIENNKVGAITTIGSATFAHSFYVIRSDFGTNTISNNTVGSAGTASSIHASSTSSSNSQSLYGIAAGSTGTTTISGNTIANLTNASTASSGFISGINSSNGTRTITNNTVHDLTVANSTVESISGIRFLTNTAAVQTITGNTIYNLSNTHPSFAGKLTGLHYMGPTTASIVSRNFIHSLSVTGASSTGAIIYGIRISQGTATCSNNIISLGGDTKTTIYGMSETGATSTNNNFYFNTVYIWGTPASGSTNKSSALLSLATSNTRDFRNNIFSNVRSTAGGTSLHYAAWFNYSASTNLTLDYNDYYAPGTGGVLGRYAGADVLTLPIITGFDANSSPTDPVFITPGGTTAANYLPQSLALVASTGTGIYTDYDGGSDRSDTKPAMGAFEYHFTGEVTVTASAGTLLSAVYPRLKAAFDAIDAGTLKGVISIAINSSITETASAVLHQSGYNGTSDYSSVHIYPTVSGLTIIGNLPGPLIDLDGADHVTIDGSVGGTGGTIDMVISNVSTAATAGTSSIRFINDASYNTITKCSLLGSSTVSLATAGGNILISTGTTSGNDQNTISYCKIGPAGTNLPSKGIHGLGPNTNATVANSTITISNCEIYDFFLAAGCAGVYAKTGNTDWSVADNKLYQSVSRAITGVMSGIYFSNPSYGNNIQITGNTIGYDTNTGTGTLTITGTGSFQGIYHKASSTAANACNINNNTISDISFSSTAGTCHGIVNASAAKSNTININDNTIKNIALVTTTGTFYGIPWGSATNMTITGNTIHDITRNGAGTVYGIYSFSYSVTENVSSNTVYNLASTAAWASTIRGIYSDTWPGAKSLQNNTIYGLSGAAGTSITGIYLGFVTTADISGNVIYSLTSTGGTDGTVDGIKSEVFSGTTVNIYQNKIYGLSSSSTGPTLRGIYIVSGPTHNVYNNFISDLTTTASNSAMPLAGIYINGGTTSNIFYNSVYLNSSSSGNDFGSSAIYASTAPTVNLQNNILVNTSVPKGAGITTAYRRSSTTLTSYSESSNANCFYAGATEDAAHAIYYDGASTYTMSAYKTLVGTTRDGFSFRELPPFTNVATTPYDLHLSAGTPTKCESGGFPVSSPIAITTDFDGETRGTTPDIGADEGSFALPDLFAPTITYIPLKNTPSLTDRVLTCTITDVSGIGTGTNQPVLYWKINAAASYIGPVAPTSISGSTYTFTFGAGVVLGDVVSYFIVAQDAFSSPNVGSTPSGATVTDSPPLSTTGPSSPNTYNVWSICGNKTVGTGGDYTTLTAAIADLNVKELCGPLTLTLLDATYPSETFPITINPNPSASATNTVTIKPNTGMTTTLSGAVANGQILKILGSYVTIDGSNSVNGTTRDLTIINTSVTTYTAVILIGSTGTTPITYVTVKNCTIINGTTNASALSIMNGSSSGNTGYFNDITVQNNSIQKSYRGIIAIAVPATGNGSGLLITGNDLNTSGANSIRLVGIYVQGVDGATVSNNNIGNMANITDNLNLTGVWFANGTVNSSISGNTISSISGTMAGPRGIAIDSGVTNSNISITGNTIAGLTTSTVGFITYGINLVGSTGNLTIEKNVISNIKNMNSGGSRAVGIYLGSALTSANISVQNNIVFDVAVYGYSSLTSYNGYGIEIGSGGGYKLYFNTVNLSANQTEVTGAPACLMIRSGVTTAASLDIRNNIFSIPATVGTNRYAVLCNAANTVFSSIDCNDYYTSGTNLGYIGATNRVDLAAWKTGTGKDVKSLNTDPGFAKAGGISPTDYIPTAAGLAAETGTGITTDYRGTVTRSATSPFMGAWEYGGNILTWNGSVDNNWGTAANWTPGTAIPNSENNLVIPNIATKPWVNEGYGSPALCNNIVIASDSKLTIASAKALSVSGNLINYADSTGLRINSDPYGTGSLKVVGSITGSASIQRYLAPDRWHLLSSPTSAQTIRDFIAQNVDIPVITTATSTYGMRDYSTGTTSVWNPYFTTTYLSNNSDQAMGVGKGYLVRTASGGTPFKLRFQGVLNSTGARIISVSRTGTNGWNLIGNPFTSAIKIYDASETIDADNFVDVNNGNFDPNFYGAYFWNDAVGQKKYDIVNKASGATFAQVGQGFFVRKKDDAGVTTMSVTSAMQFHQGAVALKSGTMLHSTIQLIASRGDLRVSTDIKFIDGTSKGLDIGYDAGILKADPSFAIYTKLVEPFDAEFQLQCLPPSGYDKMVIPVGIDSKSAGEIVFSVQAVQLVPECKVILEDKLTNTFTDLSKESYKAVVAANTAGTGRFFLHTGDIVSGIEDQVLQGKLTAYAKGNKEIRVLGEVGNDAVATLFNGLGQVVLIKKLGAGNLNIIGLPNLKSGLYLLNINDNGTPQTIKIMIRK